MEEAMRRYPNKDTTQFNGKIFSNYKKYIFIMDSNSFLHSYPFLPTIPMILYISDVEAFLFEPLHPSRGSSPEEVFGERLWKVQIRSKQQTS